MLDKECDLNFDPATTSVLETRNKKKYPPRICPHKKRKCFCEICDGKSLCKSPCPRAGKRKFYCPNCRVVRPPPSDIKFKKPYPKCPHGGRKSTCIQCDGVCLCKHPCMNAGKNKMNCRYCGGSALCTQCRFATAVNWGGLCRACGPVASKCARQREARMACRLERWADLMSIPKYTTWNKQNPEADPAQCGKYRPDFVYQLPASVVIVEFDEREHKDRALRCELARMAEISLGYGGMPVHWIRYNPDPFRIDRYLSDPDKAKREAVLLSQLREALDATADYEHFITLTFICYSVTYSLNSRRRSLLYRGDCICTYDIMLRTYKFKTVEDYTVWAEEWLERTEKRR